MREKGEFCYTIIMVIMVKKKAFVARGFKIAKPLLSTRCPFGASRFLIHAAFTGTKPISIST